MWIRIAILISLLVSSIMSFGQFHGDINKDGIIDASDYYSLKEIVLFNKIDQKHDVNNDGKVNVVDLFLLENYLYREGESNFIKKINNEESQVSFLPGKIDLDSSFVDIIFEGETNIAAFEISLLGLEKIEKVVAGAALKNSEILINENKILCIPGKSKTVGINKGLLLKLQFIKPANFSKICISKPIAVDDKGVEVKIKVGDCATYYYTTKGLDDLKKEVSGYKTPLFESDLNKDGFVDVKDLYQLEEFLLGNGQIPGYDLNEKGKLKFEISSVDLDNNTIQLKKNTSLALSYFQFGLTGINNLTGIIDGAPKNNEMEIVVNENNITAFLAQGNYLMPDDEILMNLKYDKTIDDELCIIAPQFLSSNGEVISIKIGECVSLIKIIEGCTDSLALNYNPLANKENGTCEYPPKPEKPKKVKEPKPENEKPIKEKGKVTEIENNQSEIEQKRDKLNEDKSKEVSNEIPNKEKHKIKKQKEIEESETLKVKPKEEKIKEKKKEQKNEENIAVENEEKENQKDEAIPEPFNLNDVKSGVFIPEITSEQRKQLQNITKGQVVFDSDIGNFLQFDGENWQVLNFGTNNEFKKLKKTGRFWKLR